MKDSPATPPPPPPMLVLLLTVVPAALPPPFHSIQGSVRFVPCLSWLWHGKTISGFLWLPPITSDHFRTWCTSAPDLSRHPCAREADDNMLQTLSCRPCCCGQTAQPLNGSALIYKAGEHADAHSCREDSRLLNVLPLACSGQRLGFSQVLPPRNICSFKGCHGKRQYSPLEATPALMANLEGRQD